MVFSAAAVFNPNCFDYTVTMYLGEMDNSYGVTTMMAIKPYSLCETDISTGIARFYFTNELTVTMYHQNSLGDWVSLGQIPTATEIDWYKTDGSAEERRFIVNNPT